MLSNLFLWMWDFRPVFYMNCTIRSDVHLAESRIGLLIFTY